MFVYSTKKRAQLDFVIQRSLKITIKKGILSKISGKSSRLVLAKVVFYKTFVQNLKIDVLFHFIFQALAPSLNSFEEIANLFNFLKRSESQRLNTQALQ